MGVAYSFPSLAHRWAYPARIAAGCDWPLPVLHKDGSSATPFPSSSFFAELNFTRPCPSRLRGFTYQLGRLPSFLRSSAAQVATFSAARLCSLSDLLGVACLVPSPSGLLELFSMRGSILVSTPCLLSGEGG